MGLEFAHIYEIVGGLKGKILVWVKMKISRCTPGGWGPGPVDRLAPLGHSARTNLQRDREVKMIHWMEPILRIRKRLSSRHGVILFNWDV